MGCDIHVYPEYKRKNEKTWCSYGKLELVRNYVLFSLMAGVKSEFTRISALFEPRGVAWDMGLVARLDCLLLIKDSDIKEFNEISPDGKFLVNPDWHSHSWLSTDELEKVIHPYYDIPEWLALLEILNVFKISQMDSRVVFWFDN